MKQVSLRAVNRPSPPIADTRLSGTRLVIARSVWIGLMLLYCGFYLAAVLVYSVQFHGFQEGVYAHLISTPAVVNGYDAFESSYALFTGPYATLNITLFTLLITPFWIAGNSYYVGAIEVTSYLITTPGGHFLLDGGFVQTAP